MFVKQLLQARGINPLSMSAVQSLPHPPSSLKGSAVG